MSSNYFSVTEKLPEKWEKTRTFWSLSPFSQQGTS
jgi:hypothetical protein